MAPNTPVSRVMVWISEKRATVNYHALPSRTKPEQIAHFPGPIGLRPLQGMSDRYYEEASELG